MADEPSLLTDLADFYEALPFDYLLVGHCLLVASWFPKLKDRFLLSYWVRYSQPGLTKCLLGRALSPVPTPLLTSNMLFIAICIVALGPATPYEADAIAGRLPGSLCGWHPISSAHPGPEGGTHRAADVQQRGRHLDSLLVAGQLLPRQPCCQGRIVAALPPCCQGELRLCRSATKHHDRQGLWRVYAILRDRMFAWQLQVNGHAGCRHVLAGTISKGLIITEHALAVNAAPAGDLQSHIGIHLE